jgi:hypothetical protein
MFLVWFYIWLFAIVMAPPTLGLSVLVAGSIQYWLYSRSKAKSLEEERRVHAEQVKRQELALRKFNDVFSNAERVKQNFEKMLALRNSQYGAGTYTELSEISLKLRNLNRLHAVEFHLPMEKNPKAFQSDWEKGLSREMGSHVDNLRYSHDSGWLRSADVVWFFSETDTAVAFWVDVIERSNDEVGNPLSGTMIQGWSLFGFLTARSDAVVLKSNYSVRGSNISSNDTLAALKSDEICVPQSVVSKFKSLKSGSPS